MNERERHLTRYTTPAALADMPADSPLLLGFSGGGDSALLLCLLAEECKRTGAPLTLCHVHHGIRGEEADRDAAFCQAVAEEYHLPLLVKRVAVPAERRQGESLESAARRLRYGVFAAVMRERHIPLLVTAHHADDNLETVLFRLARGTGLKGLCGIAPVRPFPEAAWEGAPVTPCLVRPLLEIGRGEIAAELVHRGLCFVTDSTNGDIRYSRNRLRAEAVPALESIADHPEIQVARTCRLLREDADFLTETAKATLAALTAEGNGALSIASLRALHVAVCKRVLLLWLAEVPELSDCHLSALLALVHTGRGTLPPLPRGDYGSPVTVRAENGYLQKGAVLPEAEADFDLPLPQRSERLPAGAFLLAWEEKTGADGQIIYKPFTRDILSFATIAAYIQNNPDARLHLRPRREGDRIAVHGVRRLLRKVQNECGVPAALRERLPLLCDGDTVLWAPFCGDDGIGDLLRTVSAPPATVFLTLTLQTRQN